MNRTTSVDSALRHTMKFNCAAYALLFLILSGTAGVFAQTPAAADRLVSVKKIDAGKAKTPEYQAKYVTAQQRSRDWFKVEVIYDTEPEWLDEVSLTYYVVVKAKQPIAGRSSLYTLFKGDVTYINVEKGRHKSDMYLHPSTLARLGDVERVATVVSTGGRVVVMEGVPSLSGANPRWWEQLPPQEGYLLNRTQTPFAMINFDDYEAIKPGKP
jgi:hypothetical protein